MRKIVLGAVIVAASLSPATALADDDDDGDCEDGDCCEGIIVMCDNEFPLVPGGSGQGEEDEDS